MSGEQPKMTARLIDDHTVRVTGCLGRRSSSFAFQKAIRLQWLGEAIGEHEATFAKPRHARNFASLQDRDVREGVL